MAKAGSYHFHRWSEYTSEGRHSLHRHSDDRINSDSGSTNVDVTADDLADLGLLGVVGIPGRPRGRRTVPVEAW